MHLARAEKKLWALMALIIVLNAGIWLFSRTQQSAWPNVPPLPSKAGLSAGALGDLQLTYRSTALMLQNLGDTGGRTTSLQDYNYEQLGRWLNAAYDLDPRSSVIAFLAAYYFGGVQDAAKLPPVIDFLERAGSRNEGKNWRWLAQAVFLARYKAQDYARALALAQKLAAYPGEIPIWARQMPAMVMSAEGDKQAAYAIMVETLRSQADTLHPNEVNFMVDYICTRILDAAAAKMDPICAGQKL